MQRSYVLPQNTTLRYFIDDKADKNLLEAKTERFIIELITNEPEVVSLMASIDMENMEKYIKPFDYNLFRKMCEYRLVASQYFAKASKK